MCYNIKLGIYGLREKRCTADELNVGQCGSFRKRAPPVIAGTLNIRGYGGMRSKVSVFHFIFGVMLIFFITIVVCLSANNKAESLAEREYDKTAPFTDGWHTADGTVLDEKTLRKINTISTDSEISIYNTLQS